MATTEARHLEEGDVIMLTGTVYSRKVSGTVLPSDVRFSNNDQRIDCYGVKILERVYTGENAMGDLRYEVFRVRTEDGEETTVEYRGRCSGTAQTGEAIQESNSMGTSQRYIWNHTE